MWYDPQQDDPYAMFSNPQEMLGPTMPADLERADMNMMERDPLLSPLNRKRDRWAWLKNAGKVLQPGVTGGMKEAGVQQPPAYGDSRGMGPGGGVDPRIQQAQNAGSSLARVFGGY